MNEKINIEYIDSNKIVPNDYNPKNKYTEDSENMEVFKKLVDSIKNFGYTEPIEVRKINDDRYEIIDGEHRYFALLELDIDKIPCNNLGEMSKDEAMTRTISKDVIKIPFDEIKLAQTMKRIELEDFKNKLPFSREEIDGKIDMLSFDWDEYVDSGLELEDKKKEEGENVMNLRVGEDDFKKIKDIAENNQSSESTEKVKIQRVDKIKLSKSVYERFKMFLKDKHDCGLSNDEIFENIISNNV